MWKPIMAICLVCVAIMAAGCVARGGGTEQTEIEDTTPVSIGLTQEAAAYQAELKQAEEFKDPFFEDHPIFCKNQYVRFIRQEVWDNRGSAGDVAWGTNVLIENDGPNVLAVVNGLDMEDYETSYRYLLPGDRMWINTTSGTHYTMEECSQSELIAVNSGLTEVSPELSELDIYESGMGSDFIEIRSICVVVTDAEKGYRDVEILFHNPGEQDIETSFVMRPDDYGYDVLSEDDLSIAAGETYLLKKPISGWSPEEAHFFRIGS